MGRGLVVNFITDDYKLSVDDVLLNSTTRRDASGQIVGVVGVGQDIIELNKVRIEQENERKEAASQIIQASNIRGNGNIRCAWIKPTPERHSYGRDAIDKSDGGAKITLQVSEGDEVVHITAQDTGKVISDDVLHRIF